MVIDYM